METKKINTNQPSKAPGMGMGMPEQSQGRRKRNRAVSEYKKSLVEKQELKALYGLSEKQLKRYVKETLAIQGAENFSEELMKRLEARLDNVFFRMGLAKTRAMARQMVSHGYALVNGKTVNVASHQVTVGDSVALKETKKKKLVFKDLQENLKKSQIPSWLKFNKDTLAADMVKMPNLAEANPPVEISLIFEFYSR